MSSSRRQSTALVRIPSSCYSAHLCAMIVCGVNKNVSIQDLERPMDGIDYMQEIFTSRMNLIGLYRFLSDAAWTWACQAWLFFRAKWELSPRMCNWLAVCLNPALPLLVDVWMYCCGHMTQSVCVCLCARVRACVCVHVCCVCSGTWTFSSRCTVWSKSWRATGGALIRCTTHRASCQLALWHATCWSSAAQWRRVEYAWAAWISRRRPWTMIACLSAVTQAPLVCDATQILPSVLTVLLYETRQQRTSHQPCRRQTNSCVICDWGHVADSLLGPYGYDSDRSTVVINSSYARDWYAHAVNDRLASNACEFPIIPCCTDLVHKPYLLGQEHLPEVAMMGMTLCL